MSTSVKLFQGYDTFTSTPRRNTAVTGTPDRSAGDAKVRYEVCTDVESVKKALNISASVSASFGFGSADAKTDFMSRLKLTTTSVTIVVYASNASTQGVSDVQLKPGVSAADARAFFKRYGDAYVSEVTTGAEFYAAYVFYSQSEEEQKKITSELDTHLGGLTGSVNASVQVGIANAKSSIRTRRFMDQEVRGFTKPEPPAENKLIEYAMAFPAKTADAPVTIRYEVSGYEEVDGVPPFDAVVANRRRYIGNRSTAGLANTYATIGAMKNAAQHLSAVYRTYGYTGDTTLPARSTQMQTDLQALDTFFQVIENDPTTAVAAPSLPSLTTGAPALRVTLKTSNFHGGSEGGLFEDLDVSSISTMTRLKKLLVRVTMHKKDIEQLYCTYESAHGTKEVVHGTDTNGTLYAFNPQSGQQVEGVIVLGDVHVHRLIIFTAAGEKLLDAPAEADDPRSAHRVFARWDRGADEVFLGFAGRAAGWIHSLAIVSAKFQPAAWTPVQIQLAA